MKVKELIEILKGSPEAEVFLSSKYTYGPRVPIEDCGTRGRNETREIYLIAAEGHNSKEGGERRVRRFKSLTVVVARPNINQDVECFIKELPKIKFKITMQMQRIAATCNITDMARDHLKRYNIVCNKLIFESTIK